MSTNVPAMNATPSTIGDDRGEQPALVLPEGAEGDPQHQASPEALHAVEDLLGGGLGQLVDDLAVGEEQHPVGVGRGHRVVGDHHDGLAEVGHGLAHEAEDLGAGPRVEVAGGLVGEDDLRLAGQGAGHGHALLLAARRARSGRWLRRSPGRRCCTTESSHCLVGLAAGEVERQRDVLERR